MLAREKKRAAWSLAIGAVCASAILGWEYRKAWIADSRLSALVEQCKVSHAGYPEPVPIPRAIIPKDYAFPDFVTSGGELMPGLCDPDALADKEWGGYALTPVQKQIADFARDAKNRYAWPRAVAVFALSCLPLIWYFLLDRVRELSAAISGRDRK